jgi:hypothetical protein
MKERRNKRRKERKKERNKKSRKGRRIRKIKKRTEKAKNLDVLVFNFCADIFLIQYNLHTLMHKTNRKT